MGHKSPLIEIIFIVGTTVAKKRCCLWAEAEGDVQASDLGIVFRACVTGAGRLSSVSWFAVADA